MKSCTCILLFLLTTFSYGQTWHTDLDDAKRIAKEHDQKIVLVFSGSDWCAPCMKLDREIWRTEEFKDYAKENYALLKADFPRRKKNALSKAQQEHNAKLAERYNPGGFFPLVVVLNGQGEVLGRLGYSKVSPQTYIKLIDELK